MWRHLHRVLSAVIPCLPARLRFRFWQYLYHRGARFWERVGMAQYVEGHMYIKLSNRIRPEEGHITRYVRNRTSIPVPVVIDNVTVGDVTALVLGELPGEMLTEVRPDEGFSSDQVSKLSAQLSSLFSQLRSLPSPHDNSVCGWNHSPVRCERIGMGASPRGPWPTVTDFHRWLLDKDEINAPQEVSEDVWRCIQEAHARKHRVCLTHNDFAPHNVLVDADLNVTGIVDWEAAGWMPEYWDFTKGLFLPWHRKGWWYQIMKEVFPQYDLERRAEFYMWEYRIHYT